MNTKSIEKLIEKITKDTNWQLDTIEQSDNEDKNIYTVSLYLDNATGEDIREEVYFDIKDNAKRDILEEFKNIGENFDADEHFKLWYGANRGEPQSPSTLLEHCKDTESDYRELARNCERELRILNKSKDNNLER